MQIVTNAIARSKSHNEIVTIRSDDAGRQGVSLEAVIDELSAECEDHVENGDVHEFWGKDIDDNEWRVHVRLPSGEE